MALRPIFQPNLPPVRASLSLGGAPRVAQPDGARNFLASLAEKERNRLRTEQVEAGTLAGIQAQQQAGAEGLAQAPEDFPPLAQQAFRQQATALHQQQFENATQRELARITREADGDPEAFNQLWQAHTTGAVEGLQSDPLAAARAQAGLTEVGAQQAAKLTEQKFAREQREAQGAFLAGQREFEAMAADELLRTGDEELLVETLGDLSDRLDAAVDAGFVDPTQRPTIEARARAQLTTEGVRGIFESRLRGNDVAGARAVVKQLEQGGFFDDNDQARRLAGQLQQTLSARVEAGETRLEANRVAARRRLQRAQDAIGRGEPVDVGRLQDDIALLTLHGTDTDAANLADFRAAVPVLQEFGPRIQSASLAGLVEVEQELVARNLDLPAGVQTTLRNQIEARREQIQEARETGDTLSVVPLTPEQADVVFNPPASEASDEDRLARPLAIREFQTERRKQAAEQAGVPLSRVPVWQDADIGRFVDGARDASRRQDPERALALVDSFFGPAMDDQGQLNPGAALGLLRSLPEDAPGEFVAVGLFAAVGKRDVAAELFTRAQRATGITPQTAGLTASDMTGLVDEVLPDIQALTAGDPRLTSTLVDVAKRAFVDLRLENQEAGTSTRADRRAVAGLFSAGVGERKVKVGRREFPQEFLGRTRAEAEERATLAREILADPEALGLFPGQFELAGRFEPEFQPDKSIAFRDTSTGMFAMKDGEIVTVPPPEETAPPSGEGSQQGFFASAAQAVTNTFDDFFTGGVNLTQAASSRRLLALPDATGQALDAAIRSGVVAQRESSEAAVAFGVTTRENVFEHVPPERVERELQKRPAGAPGGAVGAATQEAQRTQAQRRNSKGFLMAGLALFVDDMLREFPGDPFKAMAAVRVGPEVVQELVDERGEDAWTQGLDAETFAFAERAAERLR